MLKNIGKDCRIGADKWPHKKRYLPNFLLHLCICHLHLPIQAPTLCHVMFFFAWKAWYVFIFKLGLTHSKNLDGMLPKCWLDNQAVLVFLLPRVKSNKIVKTVLSSSVAIFPGSGISFFSFSGCLLETIRVFVFICLMFYGRTLNARVVNFISNIVRRSS